MLLFRVCILVLALLGLKFNMVQIHVVIGNLVNMVIGLHLIMVIGHKINMVLGLMVNMVLGLFFSTLFLILGVSSRLRLLTKVLLKSLAFDVLGA